jgi:hypothetical protein
VVDVGVSGVVVVVDGSWIGGSVVDGGGGGAVVVVVGSWIGGWVVDGGGGAWVVLVGGSVVVVGRVVGGTVVGTVVGATVLGGSVIGGCVAGGGRGWWEGWAAAAVPTKVPATAISTRAHRGERFRRGMAPTLAG